jgi:hypothetical protein
MTCPTILLLLCALIAVGTSLLSHCLDDRGGYKYRHTDWWEGFRKYGIELGSGALIYIHMEFHKVWFRHSKVDRRGDTHTDSMVIP